MNTLDSASDASEITGQSVRAIIVEVMLIVTVMFLYAGDMPPMVNEAHYLVKAKNFWQPEWCDADFFTASAKAHATFYAVFGWPTMYLSLSATAWIGRIVGWTLLAIGLQRLCDALIGKPLVSVVVAATWMAGIEYCDLAGEWVVGGIEAKVPAYGLVLLGMAQMVHRRWRYVWPLLGSASAFHVLSGGWSVLAAMTVWWFTERKREDGSRLFRPALFVGGAISLFGLIPALALTLGTSPEDSNNAAKIYAYVRLRHHLLPADFQPLWFLRHSALIVVTYALLPSDPKGWKRWCWTLVPLVVMAAFCAVYHQMAQVRPDTFDEARALQSRLLPIHTAIELTFVLLVTGVLVALWRHPINRDRWSRISWFTTFAITTASIGILIGLFATVQPDWGAKLLRYYWFRLTDAAVPLLAALLAVQAMAQCSSPRRWLGTVVVLVGCFACVHTCVTRHSDIVPPSARNTLPGVEEMDDGKAFRDWIKVCRWCNAAFDENEVFLTPRHQQTFKWYAERAEVVNWKDVPQDAENLKEWHRRFRDVFPGMLRVTIRYNKLREFQGKYGVRYMVVDQRITGDNLPLIQVYPGQPEANETYAVYQLP